MIRKVENYIKKTGMLNRGEKILVGCSGGPDSTALLYILNTLSAKWEWKIAVFYLNHGIRKEAGIEAKFVEKTAEKLSLPFYIDRIDAVSYSKIHKLSLEEGARELRYRAFEKIKDEVSADKVAVGHNLSDNVETFLMRLFQGAGIGLSGIQPIFKYIVRPLLIVSRDEILKFLHRHNIDYLTDISNYSEAFLRNKIRMDILPYIESLFPNVQVTINRSERNISDIVFALKERLKTENIIQESEKWVSIKKNAFFQLPDGARFIILNLSLQKLGMQNRLKRAHLEKIDALKERGGTIKISTGTIYIGEEIFIYRDDYLQKDNAKTLSIPGLTKFGNFSIKTEIVKNIPDIKNGDFYFDIDRITSPLTVRAKKTGDRIVPFGMEGEKKIKKVFIDKKIPRPLRDMYPVIEDKKGILIGAGTRTNRARIMKKTNRILKISIKEWKGEL